MFTSRLGRIVPEGPRAPRTGLPRPRSREPSLPPQVLLRLRSGPLQAQLRLKRRLLRSKAVNWNWRKKNLVSVYRGSSEGNLHSPELLVTKLLPVYSLVMHSELTFYSS